MKLIISNISGIPIYEQIKQQVKSAIMSGDLQADETLPSLRTLAKELKISVLTVTRAYTELEQEGFVKNIQGRGCFVLFKLCLLFLSRTIDNRSKHCLCPDTQAKFPILPYRPYDEISIGKYP